MSSDGLVAGPARADAAVDDVEHVGGAERGGAAPRVDHGVAVGFQGPDIKDGVPCDIRAADDDGYVRDVPARASVDEVDAVGGCRLDREGISESQ